MKVKENLTIPNLLSTLRIVMIPFVMIAYLKENYPLAIGLLALSGLTDVADGFIARRFHQISDLGKILDPIADKLTQFAVLVCLAVRHPILIPVAAILAVKEILTLIGAMIFMMTTVVLFVTMGLFVLDDWFDRIPDPVTTVFVCLTVACMVFAFVNYLLIYLRGRRQPEAEPAESSEK